MCAFLPSLSALLSLPSLFRVSICLHIRKSSPLHNFFQFLMEFIFIANTTISDEHRLLAGTVLLLQLSLLQLVPPGDSRMFVLAHLLPCPAVPSVPLSARAAFQLEIILNLY